MIRYFCDIWVLHFMYLWWSNFNHCDIAVFPWATLSLPLGGTNFKERLFSQATNFGLEEYHFPHNFLDHLIEPAFVQQHTLTLTPWKVNGLPNSHFHLAKVKWHNIKQKQFIRSGFFSHFFQSKRLSWTENAFNCLNWVLFIQLRTASKGGLISESFSLWLETQKKGAKSLSWAYSL